MSEHRISISLPGPAYKTLRKAVESGEYASESELIKELLSDFENGPFPSPQSYNEWLRKEVQEACAEADANPDAFYTGEQVLEQLAADRDLFAKQQHGR